MRHHGGAGIKKQIEDVSKEIETKKETSASLDKTDADLQSQIKTCSSSIVASIPVDLNLRCAVLVAWLTILIHPLQLIVPYSTRLLYHTVLGYPLQLIVPYSTRLSVAAYCTIQY